MMEFNRIYHLHMGRARCAVDLGDGSERGEYVSQDYILNRLGRPHRAISLMYCYYPYDAGWPERSSVAHADMKVGYAWDYPYDDYFPYGGGIGGSTDREPFVSMRDVRRHGQDIILTLTVDPHVSDDHLRAIGRDLRPFGRMFLRLNHEATGNWFSFNRRCTYQEVADFFVRAARVIREEAPNVSMVICIGGIEDKDATEMVQEQAFAQTIAAADVWSVDKYMALHWGWPYDVAEPEGNSHIRYNVRETFDLTRKSYERFCALNGGKAKPMTMAECNADGDVTGAYDQAEMVREFYGLIEQEQADWFTGVTMYQFRDRGRLGLEIEDPNNPDIGIAQPLLDTYKKIIHRPRFLPEMTTGAQVTLPITLRWGGAEDAEGISIPVALDANPHFCELVFDEDVNLMLCLGGRWFYKSPQARTIDLMPLFYETPLFGPKTLQLQMFAPPATGENDLSVNDGLQNSYTTLHRLPRLRVRYSPVSPQC